MTTEESRPFLDCESPWHGPNEPVAYEVVSTVINPGWVVERVCRHCAPFAEQGLREGTMFMHGTWWSARTAAIRSVVGANEEAS